MRQRGFTYVGLLLLLALMSTALAGTGTLWSTESKREKEAELMFIGQQFTGAIGSFRERTPAGQKQRFPKQLGELLDDTRWPTPQRHLRKIYIDPMTGGREWGLVRGPGGEIMGVHSLSVARPLKRHGFPDLFEAFAGAGSYRDWRFVYTAQPEAPTN
jgi:type II secretory pathway pseudopilin PulG